jgi:hypothetical protein
MTHRNIIWLLLTSGSNEPQSCRQRCWAIRKGNHYGEEHTTLFRNRQFTTFRGNLIQIGHQVGVAVAQRPEQGAEEQLLEDGAAPHILAVAHRGVEDPALAVQARPGGGEIGPLVIQVPHPGFTHTYQKAN